MPSLCKSLCETEGPISIKIRWTVTHGAIVAKKNGTVVTSPCPAVVGDIFTFTVTADTGYSFTKWNDGITDNPRTYVVSSSKSFSTVCEAACLTLSGAPVSDTPNKFYFVNGSNVQVSIDKDTWTPLSARTEYEYETSTLYVRAKTGSTPIYGFNGPFTKVSGPIMSLVNYENMAGASMALNQFYGASTGLFSTVTTLTNASELELPANKIEQYCYYLMFYNCSSLINPPALPATTLAQNCYSNMFYGCTSLTTAPALPATTLAEDCYFYMFRGCTSLTSAPSLPATTLAQSCYDQMFRGCTSLTTAPALPATTLSTSCYYSMFFGCTSLTTAPALPATTIADRCYTNMFDSCTSLTSAPTTLPATTLANYCYEAMFQNCRSLVTGPSIAAATTLAADCCKNMFYNCSSLKTVSDLNATALASGCYSCMFMNCTNLEGPIVIKAETMPSSSYTSGMFSAAGMSHPVAQHSGELVTRIIPEHNMSSWNNDNAAINPAYWEIPNTNYLKLTGSTTSDNPFNSFSFSAGANVEVSDNSYSWTSLSANDSYEVKEGTLYVRAKSGTTPIYGFMGAYTKVEGNVMNLVNHENPDIANLAANQFCNTSGYGVGLFGGQFQYCDTLVDASALELPKTSLADSCYKQMFRNCSALAQAPVISATTMASNACRLMFAGCTSLATAPALNATTLADGCYDMMFNGCTALTAAPALNVTTLAESCYAAMFAGCTSIEAAPELPATTLAPSCYDQMFDGCTSLATPPSTLTATTMFARACNAMFHNCTSLMSVPALPATVLADRCYTNMFNGCTALSTATELPGLVLKEACYAGMFNGCTHLNGPINIKATTAPSTDYTANMFTGSGTIHPRSTSSGDIVKINPDNNPMQWNQENAGIDTTYWELPSAYITLTGGTSSFTSFKFTGGANIDTSNDGATWTSLAAGTSRAVTNGKLYVRGKTGSTAVYGFQGSFTKVSGNIMALVDYSNVGSVALSEAQFADTMAGTGLFSNQTTLRDASALELPRTTLAAQCYFKMFIGCSSLTAAPALPATTLASSCYNRMFAECTSLVTPPALPATTLENYSYYYLFQGCSNLEGPIDLSHVTTTPGNNVGYMLQNAGTSHKVSEHSGEECVKIELPEATYDSWLSNAKISGVYWDTKVNAIRLTGTSFSSFKFTGGANIEVSDEGYVWNSVSSGNSITVYNNTIFIRGKSGSTSVYGISGSFTKVSGNVMSLVDYSNIDTVALNENQFTSYNNVQGLFVNVTTLIDASGLELPRTTLSTKCYNRMFAGCSALESAPALPATTLAKYCYSNMFSSCTSLQDAPALPATTMVDSCYSNMFNGCTSLTSAPALPATTLATNCYFSMFYGCTSLTGPVYIYATSPFYDGSTTACGSMFTSSGTSRPTPLPTDYNKIYVGGTVSLWNQSNCGISSRWSVSQL